MCFVGFRARQELDSSSLKGLSFASEPFKLSTAKMCISAALATFLLKALMVAYLGFSKMFVYPPICKDDFTFVVFCCTFLDMKLAFPGRQVGHYPTLLKMCVHYVCNRARDKPLNATQGGHSPNDEALSMI